MESSIKTIFQVISGLENIGDANAKSMAKELAQKWVLNNYISYVQSDGAIFEKYDVKEVRGVPLKKKHPVF